MACTNRLDLKDLSTSSHGTLFGDAAASDQELPPPTTGMPCTVNRDWTITV